MNYLNINQNLNNNILLHCSKQKNSLLIWNKKKLPKAIVFNYLPTQIKNKNRQMHIVYAYSQMTEINLTTKTGFNLIRKIISSKTLNVNVKITTLEKNLNQAYLQTKKQVTNDQIKSAKKNVDVSKKSEIQNNQRDIPFNSMIENSNLNFQHASNALFHKNENVSKGFKDKKQVKPKSKLKKKIKIFLNKIYQNQNQNLYNIKTNADLVNSKHPTSWDLCPNVNIIENKNFDKQKTNLQAFYMATSSPYGYLQSSSGHQHTRTFQNSYSKMTEINLITISLATANRIRQWAEKTLPNGKVVGEVINPETVHYKTLKPIKGGLFCERIFGPLKDHECACGKKFNIKNYLTKLTTLNFNQLEGEGEMLNEENAKEAKNTYLKQQQAALQKRYFCRVCDVEYTYSIIRRTQLGYIQLASPTTHVWFVKGIPSYISILLDMKKKHLQNVTYNSGTLTLEHSFRGRQNLPSSPKSIFESWQKIMKKQYPDKYKNQLTKSDQTIVSISDGSQKQKKADFLKLVKKQSKQKTKFKKETKFKKKHHTLKENKHPTSWDLCLNENGQLNDSYMSKVEGRKVSQEASLEIQNKKAKNWKKDLLGIWDLKICQPNKIKAKKSHLNVQMTRLIYNKMIFGDKKLLYKQNKKKYYSRAIISDTKVTYCANSSEIQTNKTLLNQWHLLLSEQNKTQVKQKRLDRDDIYIQNLNFDCKYSSEDQFTYNLSHEVGYMPSGHGDVNLNFMDRSHFVGSMPSGHGASLRDTPSEDPLSSDKRIEHLASEMLDPSHEVGYMPSGHGVSPIKTYHTNLNWRYSLHFAPLTSIFNHHQIYSQKGWFKLVSKILTIETRKLKKKKLGYNKLKQPTLNIGTNNQNVKFEHTYSSKVFYTIRKLLNFQQTIHKRILHLNKLFLVNNTNKTNIYLSTQSDLQILIILLTKNMDSQINKKSFTQFIASKQLKQGDSSRQEMQSPFHFFSSELYNYISTYKKNLSLNHSFFSFNNPKIFYQHALFNLLKIETKKQAIPLYLLVLGKDQIFLNFVRIKLCSDKPKTFLSLVQVQDNSNRFLFSSNTKEEVKNRNPLKNVSISNNNKQLQLKTNKKPSSLIFKARKYAQDLLNIIFLNVGKIFIKNTKKTNSIVSVKQILSNDFLPYPLEASHAEKNLVTKYKTLMAQSNAPLFVMGNYTDSLEISNSIINHVQKKNKKSLRHFTLKNSYQTSSNVHLFEKKKVEQIYNPLSQKLESLLANLKGIDLRAIGLQFLDNLMFCTRDLIDKASVCHARSGIYPAYGMEYPKNSSYLLEGENKHKTIISLHRTYCNRAIKLDDLFILTNTLKSYNLHFFETHTTKLTLMLVLNLINNIKKKQKNKNKMRFLKNQLKTKLVQRLHACYLFYQSLLCFEKLKKLSKKTYNLNGLMDEIYVFIPYKTRLDLRNIFQHNFNKKNVVLYYLLQQMQKTQLAIRHFLIKTNNYMFTLINKDVVFDKRWPKGHGAMKTLIDPSVSLKPVFYFLNISINNTLKVSSVKLGEKVITQTNSAFEQINMVSLIAKTANFAYKSHTSHTVSISLPDLICRKNNIFMRTKSIKKALDILQHFNNLKNFKILTYYFFFLKENNKTVVYKLYNRIIADFEMLQNKYLKNLFIVKTRLSYAKNAKKQTSYKCRLHLRLTVIFPFANINILNKPNLYFKLSNPFGKYYNVISPERNTIEIQNFINRNTTNSGSPSNNLQFSNEMHLAHARSGTGGLTSIEGQHRVSQSDVFLEKNVLPIICQKNNECRSLKKWSFKFTISNKTKSTTNESLIIKKCISKDSRYLLMLADAQASTSINKDSRYLLMLADAQASTSINKDSFSNILFFVSNFQNLFKNSKNFIVNNIYCLSHRELWEQEKDWQDFAYYYYSPINITDIPIPFYRHRNYDLLFNIDNSLNYTAEQYFPTKLQRSSLQENIVTPPKNFDFQSSMNINTTFSGAGLIEKLLNDFNYNELKKMDKQNRILLFEYNKHIKKLKKMMNSRLIKSKLVYYKACHIRDVLIRRTKLTRKIFNNALLNEINITHAHSGIGHVEYMPEGKHQKGNADTKVPYRPEHRQQPCKAETNGLNMILTLLPVLPPVLRPVLKMAGQFTISDLNRLYQRIIYRNERLKKFLKDPALSSSFEMKYAQRLLQEAVDNLIQNGKSGVVPEKDARGRLLKSLSDILKGKQGRFRQYLLGKRVDYSGRSVIVVGPRLKLHECGIPKDMALVLYSPFLIKRILNEKLADTYLSAKKICQTNPLLVSQLLREIMKACPVLLNRAPTLHRLGFQAFQPKLVDGKAILLHPLVCPAFNADFDGDQMAVHVPITFEARAEAWKLMLARNNLLSPATGEPLILPSQDMVLGCYYLTTNCAEKWSLLKKGSGMYFHSINDVVKAYNQHLIHLHAVIWVNIKGQVENANALEQPLEIRLPLTQFKQHKSQQILPIIFNKNSYFIPSQKVVNFSSESNNLNIICNVKSNLNYIEIYSKTHHVLNLNGICTNQIIRTTPGKILFNMIIKKAIEKRPALLSKYNYSTGLIKNKLLNSFELATNNFLTRQTLLRRA